MGGDEKGQRIGFQHHLQQNPGVEPQNRTAVGSKVAHFGQFGVESFRRFKMRHIDQVVHLADFAAALIDRTDLGLKHEKGSVRRAIRREVFSLPFADHCRP